MDNLVYCSTFGLEKNGKCFLHELSDKAFEESLQSCKVESGIYQKVRYDDYLNTTKKVVIEDVVIL